ncbi:MAG: NUDIX domain-containing protein [Nitrososphaeraceae archaeon]
MKLPGIHTIVTSILIHNHKVLILKRSNLVKTMKNQWAGISGYLEKNEDLLTCAYREIFEETGINKKNIALIKNGNSILVDYPKDSLCFLVYPLLFESTTSNISLNWENSEYKWIKPIEIIHYNTVPKLQEILFTLIKNYNNI